MSGSLLSRPVPRVRDARNALTLSHQTGALNAFDPSVSYVPEHMLAPSLQVRARGLPPEMHPDFGDVELYFSPEMLAGTRMYGADAWTPGSGEVAASVLFGGPVSRTDGAYRIGNAVEDWMNSRPVRNGVGGSVYFDSGPLTAGYTPQFDHPDAAINHWRRFLHDSDSPSQEPFDLSRSRAVYEAGQVVPAARLQQHGFDVDEGRAFVREMILNGLEHGGRPDIGSRARDLLNSPEQALNFTTDQIGPEAGRIIQGWVREQQLLPTTYAEVKHTGILPLREVQALVDRSNGPGSRLTRLDNDGSHLRPLLEAIGRPVPVARDFDSLPYAVRRALLFGAGGLGVGLEGLDPQ